MLDLTCQLQTVPCLSLLVCIDGASRNKRYISMKRFRQEPSKSFSMQYVWIILDLRRSFTLMYFQSPVVLDLFCPGKATSGSL